MTRRPLSVPPPPREPLLEEVGRRIRKERRRRDMTQYDLAAKAGTHQSTISGAEIGDADIRLMTLVKIANAMDLEVQDLLPPRSRGGSQVDLSRVTRDLSDVSVFVSGAARALREADTKVSALQRWVAMGAPESDGGEDAGEEDG